MEKKKTWKQRRILDTEFFPHAVQFLSAGITLLGHPEGGLWSATENRVGAQSANKQLAWSMGAPIHDIPSERGAIVQISWSANQCIEYEEFQTTGFDPTLPTANNLSLSMENILILEL